MTSQTPKSLAETLAEREDDAAELHKKGKAQPRAAKVAAQIADYLDNKLSGDQMNMLYQKHGQAIERERVRRNDATKQQELQTQESAQIFWAGGGTREEAYQAQIEIAKFLESHPQFRTDSPENARIGQLLRQWLKVETLSCTAANLEKGYRDLKASGALVFKTESEKAVERMSADQFKASRPELQEREMPARVRDAIERSLDSFVGNHPEYLHTDSNLNVLAGWLQETELPVTFANLEAAYAACKNAGLLKLSDAVIEHGTTKFIDYGPRELGIPPRPEKISFRKKLEKMTASEVAEECRIDPAFKATLDRL